MIVLEARFDSVHPVFPFIGEPRVAGDGPEGGGGDGVAELQGAVEASVGVDALRGLPRPVA